MTSSYSSISISTSSNNRARFHHQRDPQHQLFSPIITTHLAPLALPSFPAHISRPNIARTLITGPISAHLQNFSAISFILASQTATYQRSFQGHSTIDVTPKTGSFLSPNDVTSLSAQYPQYIRHDYSLYFSADLYYDRTFLRLTDSQSLMEAQFLFIVATRI